MAGAISDGLHTTGTFFWNKTAELVNANNLVYHAKNSADSLTVTFYEDLSPTGDASGEAQEREALAHFTREHIAGLELDVRGACLFTGSIGNFLTASASVEIKVAHPEIQLRMQTDYKDYSCVCLGASPAKVSGVPETANVPAQQIELVMKTDYKDYSCLCLSDNTTISVPEKPITTAGHTFYYGGGWQKGDAVKDYAFTFTIRKEGPEKTVCVTFLREKKVENGKGPEAFAYLPLKGINYEGQFDVEGACEWHTQR
ncbi:hypothetical protein CALCODRAFT_501349 [Calocera cornea HHB12733]|uniref:Uncharacterized protein n=1 Tax=Calocera cornea HHB12733 TaxID=1353952 RepID=A0A165DNW5_9BASI|nr:hypothetical protein CALCODRAFT_501349 [Calocera cornea HHB12733]